MSTKKSAVKHPTTTKPQEPLSSKIEPKPTATHASIPTLTPTLKSLYQELESLKQLVANHSALISQLQDTLAHKRRPVASNGKVQIRDKKTGTVYPSKNNAYQSLLKSGELKELVDKGLFGDIPSKNTFGWYVFVRGADRAEEVHEA